LTLVIYKSIVVFVRSFKLALVTNKVLDKFILFKTSIGLLVKINKSRMLT
jgi:hypothetical protein